jgi:thiazole tautomerase (transcriptional regulator TenI)
VVPVLHLITDDAILDHGDVVARATAVMEAVGARGAVHLRGRETRARRLYELATALKPMAANTGAWLVINDRADVALAAGISRLQLTSRSLTPRDIRGLPGSWELGVSIHSPAEAAAAEQLGANWLMAGHVFRTPSHPGQGGGPQFVAAVAAATTVPLIAIGGISPETVPAVRAAGAHGIAVIRGIWSANDAPGAATAYLTAYDAGRHE